MPPQDANPTPSFGGFGLRLGRDPVSLKALRTGQHPLSFLYADVTTKTLMRDIHFLEQQGLIVVSGDQLVANLEVMSQFIPKPSSSPEATITIPSGD